nr:pedal peptide [Tritonia tetraquetra]
NYDQITGLHGLSGFA